MWPMRRAAIAIILLAGAAAIAAFLALDFGYIGPTYTPTAVYARMPSR